MRKPTLIGRKVIPATPCGAGIIHRLIKEHAEGCASESFISKLRDATLKQLSFTVRKIEEPSLYVDIEFRDKEISGEISKTRNKLRMQFPIGFFRLKVRMKDGKKIPRLVASIHDRRSDRRSAKRIPGCGTGGNTEGIDGEGI